MSERVRVSLPPGVAVPPSSSRRPSSMSGATSVSAATLPPNAKLVHIVRHAQGHHNVFNGPTCQAPHDPRLTPEGEAQCAALQRVTAALRPTLVVASPLTRTLQTANLCFGPQAEAAGAPHIALEYVRETVNFLCDGRRALTEIVAEVCAPPSAARWDFSPCADDADAIWAKYERKHGSATAFTRHRESSDQPALRERARSALGWLCARPEREVVVVSHCAFLLHVFGTLQRGGEAGEPLFAFDDMSLEAWMAAPFCNAEMRSVIFEFPDGYG